MSLLIIFAVWQSIISADIVKNLEEIPSGLFSLTALCYVMLRILYLKSIIKIVYKKLINID